jgi:energy-coupling factor transporter transmembrane protein EcfT
MQCRGFEGEYHSIRKKRFRWADLLYALLAAAVTAAFWYLERMAA